MKRPAQSRFAGVIPVLRRSTPRLGALAAIAILAMTTALPGTSLANCPVRAGNTASTPDTPDFTDHGNGTVTHNKTGLIWKKCPEGRTYSAGSCTGTTGTYTWQAALRRGVLDTTTPTIPANSNDWRLPSRTELLSIVETGCTSPAINTTLFPNVAASAAYWTSTHAGDAAPDSAFAVRFNHGISFIATKDFAASARLVRSGNTANDYYRAAVPTEPAAFFFSPKVANIDLEIPANDQQGQWVSSEEKQITGIVTAGGLAVTITGGEFRIYNNATWGNWGTTGTIRNNDKLQLQVKAAYGYSASASATVYISGRSATFLVTTGSAPPDTDPDQFIFVNQTDVLPSALITSAPIVVGGINQSVAINVSGGAYSINGGTYTTAPGTVSNSDSVTVQHTSSASWGGGTASTTLTIGSGGEAKFGIFTSTTAVRDISPDAFSFTDQTGVALNTLIESNSITVNGINDSVSISVTGTAGRESAYQIDGGSWVNTGGTVTNGQTVKVRHRSNTGYTATVDTTLTIGDRSDIFTTTTAALDTTPDDYSFTTQTGVTRSTPVTSDPVTIAGINGPTNIALVSPADGTHQFEIRASDDITIVRAFGTANTTISNGQIVRVRHNSSASYSTSVVTTLNIGGVQRTFTSTTMAAPNDTTPDPFSFTNQNPVQLGTTITSGEITVTGISAATNLTLTGGHLYDKNLSGSFIACPVPPTVCTTVVNNDKIRVRHTSSANELAATNSMLTIGTGTTETATFTSTTGDKTPVAFTNPNIFTDVNPALINTPYESSNAISITGITIPTSIRITGGEYQINGGGWSNATQTNVVNNNDTIKVRHTSSASQTTAVNTVLYVGGATEQSDTFTTTTGDSIPATFTNPNLFTDQTNVAVNTLFTSNAITVSGITIPTAISVSGGEFQVLGTDGTTVVRDWDTASTTISNNQKVKVRHTSSASNSIAVNTTITVGPAGNQQTETFTSTTIAPACGTADWVNNVSFSNTNSDEGLSCTRKKVSINGICDSTTIAKGSAGNPTRFSYRVCNAAGTVCNTRTTTANFTINPTDTLELTFINNNNPGTWIMNISIGGANKTWQHETVNDSNRPCQPVSDFP